MSDADRIDHQHQAPDGGAEIERGALGLNKDTLRDLDSPPQSGDARGGYNIVTLFLCKDGEYVGGQLYQQQPASAVCATVFATKVTC